MPELGCNAENILDFIAKLGRPLDQCRVYFQTQNFSLNDARVKEALAAHARGEQVVATMKVASVTAAANGSDDARQAAFLNGLINAGMTDLIWGVYHEPENDVKNGAFTAAQWVAMQRHMMPLANAILHPSGGQTIEILMSWTANPSSGRNVDDYRVSEVDLIGWDIYEKAGSASGSGIVWATKDPSTMPVDEVVNGKQVGLWGLCIDVSQRWGKPWMSPEFGCLRRQADSTGAERGRYFAKVAASPRVAEARGVIYYEVGPPRFNYAFRTEAAGVAGFDAIGGTVTPPEETDAQKIARLTAENTQLKTLNATLTNLNASLHQELSDALAERDSLQVTMTQIHDLSGANGTGAI